MVLNGFLCLSLLALPPVFPSDPLCPGLPRAGADHPGHRVPACWPQNQPPEELEATLEEPGGASHPTRVHPPEGQVKTQPLQAPTKKSTQKSILCLSWGLIFLRRMRCSSCSAILPSLEFYEMLGPRGSGEDAGSGEKGAVPSAGEVLGQPQVFSHWCFSPFPPHFLLSGVIF